MDLALQTVKTTSTAHPKPTSKKFSYGTAGFRGNACGLDSVMFRMGLLAVLRSKAKSGKVIGVVITASHNPVEDNGVKLVDPLGEMLEESWEKYATRLANAEAGELVGELKGIVTQTGLDFANNASVAIARDTRPSGDELVKSLIDGINALSGTYHDYGVLTTPQLHYMIRCRNTEEAYGKSTEQGYYEKLSKAFLQLLALSGQQRKPVEIKLDGANGVGALKIKELVKHLGDSLPIIVYNDGTTGKLNENCGADFVKIKQCPPDGMVINPGDKCVTFDGDADRVLYFFLDKDKKFHLVDGDKISTLITGYFKEKLDKAGILLERGLGIVQTAYANGSSTRYVEDKLGVSVACAKTGVKYVHKKAQDFDIGVYFEANGHGTVIFSKETLDKIRTAHEEAKDGSEKYRITKELLCMIDLINEAVGDAIADMLVCEAILYQRGWAIEDWDRTYKDLPNRQRKVTVKNRTVIRTADAERKVVSPAGLQEAIDKLVHEVKHGRCFVRPSGTEDIVRVYAEGDTQNTADALALAVSRKVFDIAGGIGESP